MLVLIVVGVVVGLIGVVSVARPDLAWALTRWRNQAQGLQSQRTATWESMNRLGGGFLIFLGIGTVLTGGILTYGEQAARHRRQIFDALDVSCTREAVRVVNRGEDRRLVTVGDVHAAADALALAPDGWLGRPVVASAPGRDAVRVRGEGTLDLGPGGADRVALRFPAKPRCASDLLPGLGVLGLMPNDDGCGVLQFRFTVAASPGSAPAFSVWRTCPLDTADAPDAPTPSGPSAAPLRLSE